MPDTYFHGNWQVVQKFQHRHLWSVKETEMEKGLNGGGGLTYQDDNTEEVPVQEKEPGVHTRLRRRRERVLLDASFVENIRKRKKEGHEREDDENMVDDTVLQYCSDGEDKRQMHSDDDD